MLVGAVAGLFARRRRRNSGAPGESNLSHRRGVRHRRTRVRPAKCRRHRGPPRGRYGVAGLVRYFALGARTRRGRRLLRASERSRPRIRDPQHCHRYMDFEHCCSTPQPAEQQRESRRPSRPLQLRLPVPSRLFTGMISRRSVSPLPTTRRMSRRAASPSARTAPSPPAHSSTPATLRWASGLNLYFQPPHGQWKWHLGMPRNRLHTFAVFDSAASTTATNLPLSSVELDGAVITFIPPASCFALVVGFVAHARGRRSNSRVGGPGQRS